MAEVYGPQLPKVTNYYVLLPGLGFNTRFLKVTTPKKNSNGRYNVSRSSEDFVFSNVPMIKPLTYKSNGDIFYANLGTSTSLNQLSSSVGKSGITKDFVSKFNVAGYNYYTSVSLTLVQLIYFLGVVDSSYSNISYKKLRDKVYSDRNHTYIQKAIEKFITYMDKSIVGYIVKENSKLIGMTHVKSDVSIKMNLDYYYIEWGKEKHYKKNVTCNLYNLKVPMPDRWDHFLGEDCTITIKLNFIKQFIDEGGTWEIGSIPDSENGNGWGTTDYCFYCNDNFKIDYLKYLTPDLPMVQSIDNNKKHSQKTHTSSSKKDKSKNYTSETPVKEIKKNKKKVTSIKGNASTASLEKVGKLTLGSTGEYVDGVATCPTIVLQLLGSDDPNSASYNLTIPYTSTFVSLSHQRNLHDGYNKFTMQLFDEDALQVEAKLLLGFRYVRFYYTDMVSTSKRFKGEIMDYKNVITGKGLMLSLEGYTTNVDIYTGKDSVPWSKLYEVQDFAFFYWMNNAQEYQGEVHLTSAEGKEIDWQQYNRDDAIYNSSEGSMIPATQVKNTDGIIYRWFTDGSSCKYSMQVQDGNKLVWEEYDEFYKSVDQSARDKYRPHPKVYSLIDYNEYLENTILELFDTDSLTEVFEKRPSNVVKMICGIMKWKTKKSYIKDTKEVSAIPDQTSKSFVQYIVEDLIPISISKYANATQYSFWFDDEGYAHYEPCKVEANRKKLYFNAPNIKDSYPLISFTSAANGAVLMNSSGQNLVEALNYTTGEELDYSTIKIAKGESNIPTTIYKSEEWFDTSKITGKNKLVSYTNTSTAPSETELKSLAIYKWGEVANYMFKASLEVYGAVDLEAGKTVDIYIYLDEGKRDSSPVTSKEVVKTGEYKESDHNTFKYVDPNDLSQKSCQISVVNKGNLTLHHSSGTYFINKITDSISAGRFAKYFILQLF